MRVTIPLRWLDDWQSPRESLEYEVWEGSEVHPEPQRSIIRSVLAKIKEAEAQWSGGRMTIDITVDEARWLRGEAEYRWEFNQPFRFNNYGVEEPDRAACLASKRLMDSCDKIIERSTAQA